MQKDPRRIELVVDGKPVCLISPGTYELIPKYGQVREISIASLLESWHNFTQGHPDAQILIELEDDHRLPWESQLDQVMIAKEEDDPICDFHILTAYPISLENYTALVRSVALAPAFSIKTIDPVSDGIPGYLSENAARTWQIRLVCNSPSSTFEDFFKIRADISQMSFDLNDPHDKRDLLFRVYIPNDRLYASETDRLVSLFHNWLSNTGRNDVRLVRHQTPSGHTYEFFGGASLNGGELFKEFNDFSKFLDMCVQIPSSAAITLTQAGVKLEDAQVMVARYGKEARRLQLDLDHQRESRILAIRHSLESELVDIAIDADQWTHITELIDSLVPKIANLAPISLPALPHTTLPGSVIINQQIINAVESTVIPSVNGTTNFGIQAKELFALVQQFGGKERIELESAIHELDDPVAPRNNRLWAKERLKNFLWQLGGKVEDAALAALMKYLETKYIK